MHPTEETTEEMTTEEGAIRGAINVWRLRRRDLEQQDTQHEALPYIDAHIAALNSAIRQLRHYRELKAALAVLKDAE